MYLITCANCSSMHVEIETPMGQGTTVEIGTMAAVHLTHHPTHSIIVQVR